MRRSFLKMPISGLQGKELFHPLEASSFLRASYHQLRLILISYIEEEKMKHTRYITIAAFIFISLLLVCYAYAAIPNEWTKITPGPTNYMGRDLTPICSGFPGTNPTFSFFVKGGNVNNLVVYFQGGGACWSAQTCIVAPVFYPDVTDADNPANYKGIFDFSNPNNPFKDWSFVFIPYCTGDIHWGSNDWVYKYATGKQWTIHHRGFDNFLVVLQWIKENFRNPREIFVTGSSAGSYGAIGGFPWIKRVYPISKVSVLGDAGMGISPSEYGVQAQLVWNVQRPEWIFGKNPESIPTPDFWKILLEHYPRDKFAEFTTAWDMTQTYFYNLILKTVGVSTDEANVCADWHAKMLVTVDYKQEQPNYRSYIAAGTPHTILASPTFYTENSAGISFLDWVNAMLDGGAWEDVECTACGAPTVCPY